MGNVSSLKSFIIISMFFFSIDAEGAKINSSQALLDGAGVVTAADVQRLINLYGPYAAANAAAQIDDAYKKGLFGTLVQDRALLLEALYAHLGLLMELPVCAGVDRTKEDVISVAPFMSAGVPESLVQTNPTDSVTLSKGCATLFSTSRYIRGLGLTLDQKGTKLSPLDTFYGVIAVNTGWYGSYQAPENFSQNGGQVTGSDAQSIYWIKAGAQLTAQNSNPVFISSFKSGVIPVLGGVDRWNASQKSRTVSCVMTDDQGNAALSSTQQPFTISLEQGLGTVPRFLINGKESVLPSSVESFFKNLQNFPWAVLVHIVNQKTAAGADLQPSLVVKGFIQLNPKDFPLLYQPEKNVLPYTFSSALLFNGFELLGTTLASTPLFAGSSLEKLVAFGSCKETAIRVSLPLGEQNGQGIAPLSPALIKWHGALSYSWGTQFQIQQALAGNSAVATSVGFKQSEIDAKTLYSFIVGTVKENGQDVPVKSRSDILII